MPAVKQFAAGAFLLIAAFLLLKDGKRTSDIIQAVGGGVREVTTSLQGGA
jgi:hypothetical protein